MASAGATIVPECAEPQQSPNDDTASIEQQAHPQQPESERKDHNIISESSRQHPRGVSILVRRNELKPTLRCHDDRERERGAIRNVQVAPISRRSAFVRAFTTEPDD